MLLDLCDVDLAFRDLTPQWDHRCVSADVRNVGTTVALSEIYQFVPVDLCIVKVDTFQVYFKELASAFNAW